MVIPSKTRSFGAVVYPLPTELIPMDLIDARFSIVIIWGNPTLGLNVGSDGKSNPISLIWTLLIFPIESLSTLIRAPFPVSDVIVAIPGTE